MPFAIGKLPRGLTALLALRSQGDTPQLLADTAVLTVESQDLYLLDTRERTATFSNPAPALGANSFSAASTLVVPPGELWYVWAYIVVVQPGVGTAIRIAPAASLDGQPLFGPVGEFQTVAAGEDGRPYAPGPFWLGPGSELGFTVQSITGAPGTVSGAAIITRLRV